MKHEEYDYINTRLMRENDTIRHLIDGCNDEEIKNYLRGCINGINFCRSVTFGYVQFEEKSLLNTPSKPSTEKAE